MQDAPAFERKKAITREHLQPDSLVLEIGCGTGSLALEMSRVAGHIHALDFLGRDAPHRQREEASPGRDQRHLPPGHARRTLTPFEREHFDSVWAYSILHLVPDRPHTLATLFELLKPGGSFISSNVCLGGTWVPYGSIIAVMRWFGKAPVVHIYDRETILREMREAGFVDIEERDVGADGRSRSWWRRSPRNTDVASSACLSLRACRGGPTGRSDAPVPSPRPADRPRNGESCAPERSRSASPTADCRYGHRGAGRPSPGS